MHSPVISAGTAFTGINQSQRLVVPEAVKTRYAHLNANWLEMIIGSARATCRGIRLILIIMLSDRPVRAGFTALR